MKLILLFAFITVCFCTEKEHIKEERQIVGGGNFGGFIGLTTYIAGPFLVKGKYDIVTKKGYNGQGQRDNSAKDDSIKTKNNVDSGVQISTSLGDENIRNYKPTYDAANKNDDYLEDLGYVFDGCTENNNGYSNRGDYNGRQENADVSSSYNIGSKFSIYNDDDTRSRCDHVHGYTGPTANDEPENLIRPCVLNDWQCIRNFFAANSKCKPAYGPIPDPLYIDIHTVFHPSANLTVALPNLQVRGLSSAKVRDFYVNKESGNLVFVMDVFNLNETIPRAYLRYRRTAKESIVLADFAAISFRTITLTAVIPRIPNLRLELADIHADVQNAEFFVGPGGYNSTDPDVITSFAELNLFFPVAVREGLLFRSQLYTSIYIQKNICDFGLQIISV